MSFKKTLTLLIILILIGLYYYIYEMKISDKKDQAAQEARKVFPISQEQITEFSFTKEGSFNLVARKMDRNWRIVKPVETPGDQIAIKKFVEELAKAELDKVIDENPKDLSVFGLDKPFLKVSFQTEKASHTLLLGDRNVTQAFVYGQKEGEKKVLFLYATLRSALDKSLFELRDKSLFDFTNDDVDTMEIVHHNVKMVVKHDSDNAWSIVEPIKYRADTGSINSILMKIKGERVKEFVEENPQDLKPYGLDDPVYRLTISLKDNKGHRTILLGLEKTGKDKAHDDKPAYAQEKGLIYAKMEDLPPVLLVSSDIAKELPENVDDLRDKQVVALDRDKVYRVRIEDKEVVEFVKEEQKKEDLLERWNLTEPIQDRADLSVVGQFLYTLRDLKIDSFISEHPTELALYDLENPVTRITYWEQGEANPKALLFGKDVPHKNQVFIKLSDKEPVYTINREKEKKLLLTVFDLQYRTILDLKFEKVKEIEIKYPERAITLVKERHRWKLPAMEALANDNKIWSLFWALSDLKFEGVFSPESISREELGFYSPRMTISIVAGDNETEIITIGKRVKEDQKRVYLRLKSRDKIFTVNEDFLEKIPRQAEDLLG